MLRKGDLVEWCGTTSDKPVLGIILEDEEESKWILVYFPDDGDEEPAREPVGWLRLVSGANQG